MKVIATKIGLLIGMIFMMSHTALMHDSLSASFSLTEHDDAWVIDVSTSFTGLDVALKKKYADVDFKEITTEKYKKLAFEYVKDNIEIIANEGVVAKLKSGGIKLGNHQTDFKIIVDGIPSSVYKMNIKIPCFSINDNQLNVLRIKSKNNPFKKIILNKENNYSSIFLNQVGVFSN